MIIWRTAGNRPGVYGPDAPLSLRLKNVRDYRAKRTGGTMTLRDAIDKDQFIIEKVCYLDDELKAMSLDELETLKMQITKKISGLSLALKETADNFSMGKKRALYINQRVLVYVNSLIKKHGQKKTSLADHFFVRARAILPPMLFEQILNEAQASAKGGDGV
jgi:hypothetical protein